MIRIRGARTHNLRDVDVDLPAGQLIVMTGVSGSGKSSLAFDTLFAEGQRRYLESVSPDTRSLLRQLPRPDVDEISGLPPTVSVDQRVTTAPARSTLALTTEIYDYLRLLYARAGTAHCTQCNRAVSSQTVDQIVGRTLQLPDRSRLMILSPMVRGRRGAHRDVLERIGRNGFVRVRIDGQLLDIADCPTLDPSENHTIEAVVDRIVLKPEIDQRLRESVELACRESDGTCVVCRQTEQGWDEKLFSTRYCCPDCDLNFPTPEPRIFSFNSAWGACPACEGFGIRGIAEDEGDITVFRRAPCPECHGSRLQPFARSVQFMNRTIAEFTAQDVSQALETVSEWQRAISEQSLPAQEARLAAERILPEISSRLLCLQRVGIGYLTLNRPTRTLSGGEFQRARLAACLGNGLHGACFVLDEPTAGLHPRDTHQLIQILKSLRDNGATVVLVEHDGQMMRAADCLIDLGPLAGAEGGRLLYAGPPDSAALPAESPTGRFLRGELILPQRDAVRTSVQKELFEPPADADAGPQFLTIRNARLNNLTGITVEFPLQQLVCVSGVSGSGKSSLVMDTLLPIATATCQQSPNVLSAVADARCDGIDGLHRIERVISIDHSLPGRNSRSCVATLSGLWDLVRQIFAKTREARARGYSPQRFSFNAGTGRCAECRGVGSKSLQMSFLPDAVVPCPVCRGKRFSRATLAVRFKGRSVADVLDMRLDEALEFFNEFSRIRDLLNTFCRVGLGYLKLGQPAGTFSGGESQRVRLAMELTTPAAQHTLYVLDEPTGGLHPLDVYHLLQLLKEIVRAGHSMIVVEHHPDVIRAADWIVDLGPDSGPAGGDLIYSGPAAEFLKVPNSLTAAALRSC